MNKAVTLVLVAASALFACDGCGDPDPYGLPDISVPDMAVDVGADLSDSSLRDDSLPDMGGSMLGSRSLLPEQEGVDPSGATDITTALDAEARAGRFTSSDTGFYGLWSHCKQGDFKLYNDSVEACISNEVSARYETFAGGALLDVRPVAHTGPDVFDLLSGSIGYNTVHAETVRVLRDGSDGGPAVIRVEGTDMPSAYFVGVAGHQLFNPLGLDVAVEYRLGPSDDFIEILTFVTNNSDRPAMVQKGDMLGWGDRQAEYRQDYGFGVGVGEFSWMAAYGEGHAFAWVTPDDTFRSLTASFGSLPWEITQADAFVLQPGESFAHFGRLVVADLLDPALRRAQELLGNTPPLQRTLTVEDMAGNPIVGRRVEVFDAMDKSVTGGTSDEMGRVPVSIPDGPHRLEVQGISGGGGLSTDLALGPDDTALTAVVATPGFVEFTTTVGGVASPASILLTSALGSFEGATWDNHNRVELLAGDWTVIVARGPEYDAVTQEVTVVPGETVMVTADLTRVLDTANWIAGDFHQHMEPSSDSLVRVEERVLDNVAQGVELLVPTDHDVVTDLAPIIAAAGLQNEVATFPGAEISPAVAHTNMYPLSYAASEPGRGTVQLAVLEDGSPRRRTVPELIAMARAMPTDPVIQINHPRGSSGLFDHVGFDPELEPASVTSDWWTTDFDAMEVSNGDACQQFADLSGLWNAGVEPTPIGSSDSHSLWGAAGSDRTYLHMPGVSPSAVTAEAVRDVVKQGQVVVGSSALIEFTDGTKPGDTLDGATGTVVFSVRVQSADWVAIDEIQVVVNGTVTQVLPVAPTTDTVDFEDTIPVIVSEDSWVVFIASGAARGAYRPSRTLPYAFNSPVRIDFDGGGYSSPGVRALAVDTIPLCD